MREQLTDEEKQAFTKTTHEVGFESVVAYIAFQASVMAELKSLNGDQSAVKQLTQIEMALLRANNEIGKALRPVPKRWRRRR